VIGFRYAKIQTGPISIASPATEIATDDTFSILWSLGHTVSSLRNEIMSFGASLENQSLSQGMPRGFHGPPNATFSKKLRPGDLVFGWIETRSSS
jgi:hypothetical protein